MAALLQRGVFVCRLQAIEIEELPLGGQHHAAEPNLPPEDVPGPCILRTRFKC